MSVTIAARTLLAHMTYSKYFLRSDTFRDEEHSRIPKRRLLSLCYINENLKMSPSSQILASYSMFPVIFHDQQFRDAINCVIIFHTP